MFEEDRVFDVTKPKHVSPAATSKPVIVGHQPMISDPMVKDEAAGSPQPTRITVNDGSEDKSLDHHMAETSAPAIIDPPVHHPEPAAEQHHDSLSPPAPPVMAEPDHHQPPVQHETVSDEPEWPPRPAPSEPLPPMADPAPQPAHIEGLHISPPRRRGRGLKLFFVLILLLVVAYLVLDSRLIKNSINFPFDVFKQKTAQSTNPPPPAAPATPAIPAGFNEYKLDKTNLTFAAPAAWGKPTSTSDPGYSHRGNNSQSDGTYAFLVSFDTNKDVQVAVTSSKYLPTARGTLYYDFLQWCTGTNDGKIYEGTLHFTTENKVDTPSTISCDQGPVASAVKLDSTTIVQAKAQDTSGKVIGDIYSKNLTDPSLVVFRVKDAAMTNGADIKQLLETVKVGS
jgi:hypothetical protein